MARKRLLLLHTGGTLGMVAGDAGGLRPAALADEVFRFIPEAQEIGEVEVRVLANLDSADVNIAHWQLIADAIEAELDAFDGFVVIHGTDTMAYTAAALSYMLANLPKPVILTGAQRPIRAVRTDAKANLVTALELATLDIPEVGLAFSYRLFRGNRATKVSIDEFDAFASPNYPPLAEVGLNVDLKRDALRKPSGLFRVQRAFSDKVLALRVFPALRPEHLMPLLDADVKAFVFEAYGAGNVASHERSLIPFFREAHSRGKLVALCSQALAGAVDLTLYEGGRLAAEAGALSCRDMTAEAALVKLMFLLGQYGEDVERVRRNFEVSIAGEVSEA